MAKSQQTFSKKEKEQKRLKKRKDKLQKKEERKAYAVEGKLENMLAYVDENGNISDSPPDPERKRKEIDHSSIALGATKRPEEDGEELVNKGKVSFFNDSKGFGFIKEQSGMDVFVHVHALNGLTIKEGDKVSFKLERGPKGWNAINVKKL
ncbi:MAG: cold shock domain-containing protein [Bacteroidetes bacterium]|jgi:cold shock CspA family protein|nr:cold shock domain-containing protein [Bacteroidota bacterium]